MHETGFLHLVSNISVEPITDRRCYKWGETIIYIDIVFQIPIVDFRFSNNHVAQL